MYQHQQCGVEQGMERTGPRWRVSIQGPQLGVLMPSYLCGSKKSENATFKPDAPSP